MTMITMIELNAGIFRQRLKDEISNSTPDWDQIERDLRSLKYYIEHDNQRFAWQKNERPPIGAGINSVHCSLPGCQIDARSIDGCLLKIGDNWFCREHIPPRKDGNVKPVGWTAREEEREKRQQNIKGALDKLEKSERSLVNSRLV